MLDKKLPLAHEINDADIHYNPVQIRDTVGTIALAIIALALLVAFLHSQKELREALKNR